jgi:dTDP-4-dehydrorhamnose reductase
VRILILGGDGMLGHELLTQLGRRHEVRVTLRQPLNAYARFDLFTADNSYDIVDVRAFGRLIEVMASFKPEAVVNAVGIVKQRPDAKEIIPSLEINALFPHRLALLCEATGARLVHLSTDCVFSGVKGDYQEDDVSDARDIYGRTKYLGEVHASNALTLRTSIIGRELSRHTSLLDWFLSQTGVVRGFSRAIYTGFTTTEMSRIIDFLLTRFPTACGVYHVSSAPISKYELLLLVQKALGHQVEIVPDPSFVCDRSLDSSRFRAAFGYTPPAWAAMIDELRDQK